MNRRERKNACLKEILYWMEVGAKEHQTIFQIAANICAVRERFEKDVLTGYEKEYLRGAMAATYKALYAGKFELGTYLKDRNGVPFYWNTGGDAYKILDRLPEDLGGRSPYHYVNVQGFCNGLYWNGTNGANPFQLYGTTPAVENAEYKHCDYAIQSVEYAKFNDRSRTCRSHTSYADVLFASTLRYL